MIRTALTDLLSIPHPILQGGMAWVSTWELVVAVSEAGGLGIIGAGNAPIGQVRDQVRQVRAHTDRIFGLNVPLFSPTVEEVVNLCIEERVPVLTTGSGNPSALIPRLKAAGVIVMPVVSSVALASRLEQVGADGVIAEGLESGGHIGDVTTMALVPQVVDAVRIPVIAAGALSDGRGLVAALAMGAAGIQMGTRFICSDECIVHDNYKQAIVRATERSTIVTGSSIGHPVRCIKNPMSRQFQDMERKGISEAEIVEFGAGRLRMAVRDGDVVNGSVMAGQGAGLVHDIAPAGEIVRRTVAEAEAILSRLQGLITAG
jgi:enoyl-[acyl-carrier protein] reductase II